jgi:NADPH:quinone reductase-like Zn-dependent oxidoreductase
MLRAMDHHRTRPEIDRVFAFDEAPEAFRYLEAGKHFGKVCIRLPGDASDGQQL